jgi:DNA polymerase III alpha subunit
VSVAGLVTARQRPATAKGYVFVLLEDESGLISVIVKPPIYERDRSTVRTEPFILVRGRLQKDGAIMNVLASQVESLRMAPLVSGEQLRGGLPDTLKYWGNRQASAFRYLTALRQAPPGVKSFG